MCGCESGFVCLRCIGTPFDDAYDEGRTVTEREFASMTSEPYVYLPPEPVYRESDSG